VPYVPVVDISGDPVVVGAELDEICRTAGFFQITRHGIPGDVGESEWTMATRFFDLSLADKLSVARPAPDYPYGYLPLAGESMSQSAGGTAPPDLKEVFNIRPARPGTAPTRRSRRGVGLLGEPVARGAVGPAAHVDRLLRRYARARHPADDAIRARAGPAAWLFRRARPATPRTRCAPSITRPGTPPRCPGSRGPAPTRTTAR
jgi:isopenicillin N synthase-like dioxygenase